MIVLQIFWIPQRKFFIENFGTFGLRSRSIADQIYSEIRNEPKSMVMLVLLFYDSYVRQTKSVCISKKYGVFQINSHSMYRSSTYSHCYFLHDSLISTPILKT